MGNRTCGTGPTTLEVSERVSWETEERITPKGGQKAAACLTSFWPSRNTQPLCVPDAIVPSIGLEKRPGRLAKEAARANIQCMEYSLTPIRFGPIVAVELDLVPLPAHQPCH